MVDCIATVRSAIMKTIPAGMVFFALQRAQKHAENADLKLNKNFKNCDKIDYINMKKSATDT